MARRATVIREERSKAQHALVLDAGDSMLNDANPAKSTRGRTSIEVMNLMDYDAMALGLLDVSLLTLQELRERIDEADFSVLSANAYVTGTKDLVTDPYAVVEMADHRVGILGLTDPGEASDVSVSDPLEGAKRWLPELQSAADIIVVLSHAGLETDKRIAERVPGIDVIVSGRNMTTYEPLIVSPNGTMIVHADTARSGQAGTIVGVAHLSFDRAGRLLEHDFEKVVLTSDHEDDTEILDWLRELWESG